jgi:hypothetical protein
MKRGGVPDRQRSMAGETAAVPAQGQDLPVMTRVYSGGNMPGVPPCPSESKTHEREVRVHQVDHHRDIRSRDQNYEVRDLE